MNLKKCESPLRLPGAWRRRIEKPVSRHLRRRRMRGSKAGQSAPPTGILLTGEPEPPVKPLSTVGSG
jgi:hypothetical protein